MRIILRLTVGLTLGLPFGLAYRLAVVAALLMCHPGVGGAAGEPPPPSFQDVDGDGKNNDADNCPCAPNSDQKDTDGDQIGDACDGSPATAARPSGQVSANQDSDSDGVADRVDNCPEQSNPNQADADRDGVGDSCDNCLCRSNPIHTPDRRQPDGDNDGVGDVCDVCPAAPNTTQDVGPDGAGAICPDARVTAWETVSREPRDHIQIFLRPLYAIWWGKDLPTRGTSTAGINLYASGSIDTWRYRRGDIPGAVAQPWFAEPPSWYWRAGVFVDPRVTDVATAGPVVGADYRPLNSDRWMNHPLLRLLTVGAQAHFFYAYDFARGAGSRADLGLGVKLAAFDVLSVVPFVQLNLRDSAAVSSGAIVLFDLKVLEQLGVKDRVPFVRKLLWTD